MSQNLGLILLVDDNEDDYEATLRSLRKNHLLNPVHWCKSGGDARDYLYHQGKYTDDDSVRRPTLMLLDLNMPGLDGRQLLRELKADRDMCAIPTIILTTSNDPKDIEECYTLGASTFIQKPVEFEGLTKAIQTMKDYWFGIALLPKSDEANNG
ncbi:two-component system, unclassified family, response regulator [Pseudoalteromonas rubra]|uniref:Two-component system, unclassified family, response regulator n=1 Tax=Pseudoalteromonas rubra TaxID=43658 RepID=A0A8T0C8G6_9GAMM|nr:response regulator [Pseudoalteromonas rubra]KAF7787006.1 two-component system, unclassified family, response regulator [Pseudoalteromonas rubra]